MKRFFKILLGLAGAVIVLLVIAGIALPLIYDTEDLKEILTSQVEERTGRELQIDGPLDFSVFPWIAVEVQDLTLGNASGFGEQPFAKIGQARIGVALIPLFRKQIAVDEVTLEGLELALAVKPNGQNNWDDLSGLEEASAQADGESETATFSSQRIAGLNIRDARIEFNDQQAGSHYRLSDFSMKTGPIGDGKPLPLELAALLEDLEAGSASDITFSATATLDPDQERYAFDEVQFSLNPRQANGEAGPAATDISAPSVVANLAAQTLEMGEFSLTLAGLDATGALSASKILDNPAFKGSISVAEFSPRKLMSELEMEPLATADPDVLSSASLRTSFSGSSDSLHLPDLDLNLDQSVINGEIDIRNFNRPKIGFTFKVDQIDIDRYLEPTDPDAASEEVAMPREELKGQEVKGQLNVAALRMAGLDFTDATVGVNVAQGKLRLNPLTAGFYGGKYNGDIVLDSSGSVPVISLDEKIDSITFQRLVSDLVDTESLSGLAEGYVKLTGRGNNSSEVLSSMSGEFGLNLSDGALEGINIWHEIRKGMAKYKGLAPPPPEPERTVFSRMQVDALVNDGVANTKQLVAELPFLTLTGKGAVNLGQSTVDLQLVAAVRDVPELASDPLTAELNGKQLPFRVTGAMDDPKVMLDFEQLLKSEAAGMLLNKLLKPSKKAGDEESGDAATEDEPVTEGEEETADDSLEDTAKGALFQLLKGSKKEKDEDETL